jgi:S1-C subfamily serine protease
MFEQENRFYGPYTPAAQSSSSAQAGILDERPAPHAWSEQGVSDASRPPRFPMEPPAPPTPPQRPRKRSGRTGAIILLALVLATIFGVGLFAGWQFAGKSDATGTTSQTTTTSSSANTPSTQQEVAIAKVEPSVVELNVTTSQGQQIGSGVIIDTRGDIVTNNHVVNGAQTINVVLNNGTSEQVQLVGTDPADDLAVVRIAPFAGMTVAQIGDSSKLAAGQEVLAIGNPLGITETATRGIVSALNRSVTESTGATISHAIQTDASINPGNSGGALVNLQGQLVGIPTLTAVNTESNTPANGVGFAIPSNLVVTAVHKMTQQG